MHTWTLILLAIHQNNVQLHMYVDLTERSENCTASLQTWANTQGPKTLQAMLMAHRYTGTQEHHRYTHFYIYIYRARLHRKSDRKDRQQAHTASCFDCMIMLLVVTTNSTSHYSPLPCACTQICHSHISSSGSPSCIKVSHVSWSTCLEGRCALKACNIAENNHLCTMAD